MNQNYHDTEWDIPVHDDRLMFEHLTLECLPCGLSWDLMMKKRKIKRHPEIGCRFSFGWVQNAQSKTDWVIHSLLLI